MSIPTVKVRFKNGAFGDTVVLINRTDFNAELHEVHDEQAELATRFKSVIAGAGYSPAAVESIFEEYFARYIAEPGKFEEMLQEYEQEQEARRKRDREALDEDAAKEAAEKAAATISSHPADVPETTTAGASTDTLSTASATAAKPTKFKVGQSSSQG